MDENSVEMAIDLAIMALSRAKASVHNRHSFLDYLDTALLELGVSLLVSGADNTEFSEFRSTNAMAELKLQANG